MSFDEQPDGDPHGECTAEIHRLESEVDRLQKRIEIISKAAPDPGTLRNMLRAMQNGEMTVSRGVELVDMWLAGNYSDDMLPPVREGLGEDEMPWDRIDALTAEVASAIAYNRNLQDAIEAYRAEVAELQALSVTNILIDVVPGEDGMGLEVYAKSVADVECEFSSMVDRIESLEQQRDAALAKEQP